MNRDSNIYTFIFAAAMVLVVASTLAFTASSLRDLQAENVRKEKCKTFWQPSELKLIGNKQKRSTKSTLHRSLPLQAREVSMKK